MATIKAWVLFMLILSASAWISYRFSLIFCEKMAATNPRRARALRILIFGSTFLFTAGILSFSLLYMLTFKIV